jgi:hypothetical protein
LKSIKVEFPDDVYEVLEDLARRQGKTKGEVLRDALLLAQWFEDQEREGSRVLVEKGARVQQVIKH